MSRIATQCYKTRGDYGQYIFNLQYKINTDGLKFNTILVRITDEDAAGNNTVLERSYNNTQATIFSNLGEKQLRGCIGHLLLVHLIIDHRETETDWVFLGERDRIDVSVTVDTIRGVVRYTFQNSSQTKDIFFSQGDIIITLVPRNCKPMFELPFPGFMLGRNGASTFIVPIDNEVNPGLLKFRPEISARYEFCNRT